MNPFPKGIVRFLAHVATVTDPGQLERFLGQIERSSVVLANITSAQDEVARFATPQRTLLFVVAIQKILNDVRWARDIRFCSKASKDLCIVVW